MKITKGFFLVLIVTVFMVSTPALCEDDVQKGGVRGLEERMKDLEATVKGLQFSGVIEVEGNYTRVDFADPAQMDEKSSDLSLATVEFAVDAGISDRIKGHILFLFEEDGTEGVEVDEAIIHIHAEEVCVPDRSLNIPWYASIGRLYLPFGYFESHFITDPLTLDLGETRETAVIAGIHNPWINIAAGAFNGDVDETGQEDHIETFVAAVYLTLPENTAPNFGFMAGVSYISNIADSNGLNDILTEVLTPNPVEVEDYVPGYGAFVSVSIIERIFMEAEYLAAAEGFADTAAIAAALGKEFEPAAWNIELAVAPIENLELALRYGGSDDALNTLPETQYGAVVTYGFFESTSLSLEYLVNQFENDDEENYVTAQLAIEF